MPKILKCCSPRCIFRKFQTPPLPPLDLRLNPPNLNFLDDILYTGTALYGQIVNTNIINGYLGHNHLPDIVSLRGSNFNISYVLDVYNYNLQFSHASSECV